jgi:hypothetical protein
VKSETRNPKQTEKVALVMGKTSSRAHRGFWLVVPCLILFCADCSGIRISDFRYFFQ